MNIMWAFEEVSIYGVSSLNDFTFLHCYDCSKPVYNSTCGDAIRFVRSSFSSLNFFLKRELEQPALQ
jgi:hypothetical protein